MHSLLDDMSEAPCESGCIRTRWSFHPVCDRRDGCPVVARQLRDEAFLKVDAATSVDWKFAADRAIANLANQGLEFTADDLRDLVGAPERPGAMGARLAANVKRGVIVPVGTAPARKASSHASFIRTYRGR
jgi:hypothetical protein